METKQIQIKVTGAATLPIDELIAFQGDLKHLERDQYEKLRANIIELGFSFPFHVWVHEGKNNIIDGHQRLTALKLMRENEGFVIPPLPVNYVEAENLAQAKRKVLAAASQYGTFSDLGLLNFMKDAAIDLPELMGKFDFPEIDMQKFGAEHFNLKDVTVPTVSEPMPEMKVSSDGVRQVQLFFEAEHHEEFLRMVEALSPKYGALNVTDTLMGVVREAYNSLQPAQ